MQGIRFRDQVTKGKKGRVELPFFSFYGDAEKHLPDVGFDYIEIPSVAGYMDASDHAPVSQLFEAHTGITAADIQSLAYRALLR